MIFNKTCKMLVFSCRFGRSRLTRFDRITPEKAQKSKILIYQDPLSTSQGSQKGHRGPRRVPRGPTHDFQQNTHKILVFSFKFGWSRWTRRGPKNTRKPPKIEDFDISGPFLDFPRGLLAALRALEGYTEVLYIIFSQNTLKMTVFSCRFGRSRWTRFSPKNIRKSPKIENFDILRPSWDLPGVLGGFYGTYTCTPEVLER